MTNIDCQVESLEVLTSVVNDVKLKPASETSFQPGQYLEILLAEDDRRAYSIANGLDSNGTIELHVGAPADDAKAQEVVAALQSGSVTISQPQGKAFYREDSDLPMILVAGGTGYSYTRSILQAVLQKQPQRPVHLFWGTRSLGDMYDFNALNELANQHANFTFQPVVENPPADWQGLTGWVHQAVLDSFEDLSGFQVYVAGRFEMAGLIRDEFTPKGLQSDNLFGDAYAFI